MYNYLARVLRWVDGDTVKMEVDLGFHVKITETFRLLGVDTPERGEPNYNEAKSMAESLAPVGSLVYVRTHKQDKYGRWLVDIPLVATGLASANLLKPEN